MLDDDESPTATDDDDEPTCDEHIGGAAPSIKLVVRGIKRRPMKRAFDIVLAGAIVVMGFVVIVLMPLDCVMGFVWYVVSGGFR